MASGVRRAPLGDVLGPLPLWAVVAVGVGGSVGRGSAGEGPRAAVARSLPALTTELVSPPGAGLLVATIGAVTLLVLAHRGRGRDQLGIGVGVLALVVVAATVSGGVALRDEAARAGVLTRLAATGGLLPVELTVVTEPRPIARGWHVLARVDEVAGTAVRERVALVLEEEPPALGERWRATASARPLPDGGYGVWLAQQHARVVLDVEGIERLGPGGPAARSTEWLRSRVRQAATRHLDARTGGLLVGFVTGDTRLLPAEDREAMQATSLTHLTAVSGTNVAIVIGGVLGLAGLLRAPPVVRRTAVAAVVPWFAFLTRFEPSVLRAGSMALLLLLAGVRGHVRDARHALAVAVLLLVLLDPRLAASLGLLLSATATAGVLLVAPVVRDRLPARIPRRVATLVGVTVGAQVAVLPVLLATFGELALVSVPANLLAVPAAVVAATLSFVATALAVVHVELAAWGFALAGPGARTVLLVAEHLSGRGAAIDVARPLTVVAAAAGLLWLLASTRGVARRVGAAVTVLALLLAGLPAVTGSLRPAGLTITAIDVGQGDAFLVESPAARVLVDAGEDGTAARWLRQHGRRQLDLVVVTHPHLDHVGGVPEVLRRIRVGAVWALPLPTELPEAAEVWRVAAARGVPVRAPSRSTTVQLADLTIEVLHPPPGRPYRFARSELNESSLVLRFDHGGARLLTTGDIELEAQRDLLASDRQRLRAEVLTVPHHGAGTTDPAFLAAVAPQVAIISAGEDNRHGHPHADTLAALDALGAQVRRTDSEGTVTVRVPRPQRGHASASLALPTGSPALAGLPPAGGARILGPEAGELGMPGVGTGVTRPGPPAATGAAQARAPPAASL
ncbi:MAG: DNA internalization-related competence protein ComEC/Rec2 [Nitriliruptor sp.]|nr:MAG: DNA internalization-related competence protein ComEC/Rec2 [Nitriliruptor sp.]